MTGSLHNPKSLPRWKGAQRRIGITGGIASGKSSVSNFLKETKALPIIDADIYAKDALAPGESCTRKVIEHFGNAICEEPFTEEPSINRHRLSQIIFKSKSEKLWLEELIHPIVVKRIISELSILGNEPLVILVIPLLFEAKLTGICSEIWLINCSPEKQLDRLMKRDHLNENDAKAIIRNQLPLKEKLILADEIINNSGKHKAWIHQVEKLL